eukprot:12695094-Ditylum_brightwellii.AAC.1
MAQGKLFFNAINACLGFWERVSFQDSIGHLLRKEYMYSVTGTVQAAHNLHFSDEEQVTIWVESSENPIKVKMSCPPISKLSVLAPRLAKQNNHYFSIASRASMHTYQQRLKVK